MRSICQIILACFLFTPWLILHADEYYSDDIFTAIAEAKERTHHYDYSNALRYNRSTSQSIQIPRLLGKEMGQTSIETPELADIEGKGVGDSATTTPALSTNNNEHARPSVSTTSNLVNPAGQQGVSVRAYAN